MEKYMGRSIVEKSIMTREKQNSGRAVDRLVMDELLKMGFSYGNIGTHYLHDSIAVSTELRLEDFSGVDEFCRKASEIVRKKYNISSYQYYVAISTSIEKVFDTGNTEYLMETFKGCCDKDILKVQRKVFIMTVRPKIMAAMDPQDLCSGDQLRLVIKGTVEKITDYALLKGISDIVLSLAGGAMA